MSFCIVKKSISITLSCIFLISNLPQVSARPVLDTADRFDLAPSAQAAKLADIAHEIVLGGIVTKVLARHGIDNLHSLTRRWRQISSEIKSEIFTDNSFKIGVFDGCIYIMRGKFLQRYTVNKNVRDGLYVSALEQYEHDQSVKLFDEQIELGDKKLFAQVYIITPAIEGYIQSVNRFLPGDLTELDLGTEDKYLDVLDQNGNPTGERKSIELVHRDGDWHQTANIILIDKNGNLVIQRKADSHKTHPDMLTTPGGHLDSGIEHKETVLDEVQDEIGISLDENRLVLLGYETYDSTMYPERLSGGRINREKRSLWLYVLSDEEAGRINYIAKNIDTQREKGLLSETKEIVFLPLSGVVDEVAKLGDSQTKYTPDLAMLVFKDTNVIDRIRGILRDIPKTLTPIGLQEGIREKGALVFDVDGTLLSSKRTLDDEPVMLNTILDLLQYGFRIAIISGNSRTEQIRRIWDPIKKKLSERGLLGKSENFVIYANGGATKVVFDKEGKEILDEAYNSDKRVSGADIKVIKTILREMLKDKLGLSADELEEWQDWFSVREDFPNVTFSLPWIDGSGHEIKTVDAEDMAAVTRGDKPPLQLGSPWIEVRDGTQLSIKLLPKLPKDIRDELIRRIEEEFSKIGRTCNLILRPGGFASIDINLKGIDKATAVRDLMRYWDLNDTGEVLYFGDEFYEKGNDLPVLQVKGISAISVTSDKEKIHPDAEERVRWIGSGPEAIKAYLIKNLEDLKLKEALPILGLSRDADLDTILWGTGAEKSKFRIAIEKFMGVSDLVTDQRIPDHADQAENRAKRALRQAVIKLAELNKPLSDITQEEFNSVLGISQVVMAGGLAERYNPLLHKGLGTIEQLGDTNMRLAIHGSYKSPGARPVIAIGNRLILWLLKDEIIEELLNSGKDIEPFMIGKLKELGLELDIKDGVIQKSVVIPADIIDPDKKALFFTADAAITYFHHYGYGDAFVQSLMSMREQGTLNQTKYKQYVFAEMAEAGMPDQAFASFITYLEAVANDSLITMGAKEADPKKEAEAIAAKKGNLFLDNGRLIAFTDAAALPKYRKDRLKKALARLAVWNELSTEEKNEIRKNFTVTEDGHILISANCGVFRNDIADYFEDFYHYDDDGNKPGFLKIDYDEGGNRVEICQIDPKRGEPIYTAPDLVETVGRVWQALGLNISDLPVGYVNTGKAPSSIKDMSTQVKVNRKLLDYMETMLGKKAGVFLGPNADRRLEELEYKDGIYVNPDDLALLLKRGEILRRQIFYTAILGSKNYKALLKVFNGDRAKLREEIDATAVKTGMTPAQVVLGLVGSESYNSFGLNGAKKENSRAPPKIVTLTGGTAISSFLMEALKKAGIKAENGGLLLASLLSTLDDGGSTYRIIKDLNDHGYGVLPPPGDQVNVLLAGLASLDKVKYILGDSGRVREDLLEQLKREGTVVTLENIMVILLKKTYMDGELAKSKDLLYFVGNILSASRIIDTNYIQKGILKLEGASIRNLFLLAILHEYGLLSPGKNPGSPAIDSESEIAAYNNALLALAEISGVKDGVVAPVSFDPVTMYVQYEDNVLIWEEEGTDKKAKHIILIKPSAGGIRIKYEQGKNRLVESVLANKETITIDKDPNKINITNEDGRPVIEIKGERWILEESNDTAFLVNAADSAAKYMLANDGSGCGRRQGEEQFNPMSIGGIKLYLRPRIVAMQTNITETANFSRIVKIGLLDKYLTGKPDFSGKKYLYANQDAVRFIDSVQDMVIVGPGSMFTSILPHFMVPEVVNALNNAKLRGKRVVWIMNGTIDNETVGLSVSDIIGFMEQISGRKVEDIFTDIIFTSYDEAKADLDLKRVLHQKPVIEAREPGMASREAKKSRGVLVPTEDEIKQLKKRGLAVHQDYLLCIKEIRDRVTGKKSYKIAQDPKKVGKILKEIDSGIVWSHEIEEQWKITKYDPDKKHLTAEIKYYWKGKLLGELYLDLDPISASINTCYIRSYKTGQGIAQEMLSRAYVGAYYISDFLGWGTQWAHAYYTLSQNEEREAELWSTERWVWKHEKSPESKIIREIGLVKAEIPGREYLNGIYGRYNDRGLNLSEFVSKIEDRWLDLFYKDRAIKLLSEEYWGKVGKQMKKIAGEIAGLLESNAITIAGNLTKTPPKAGPVAKIRTGEYTEIMEIEVNYGKLGEGIDKGRGKVHEKYGLINRPRLEKVLDELKTEYGPGILAVTDAIRVVDNIDANKGYNKVPYAQMIREGNRCILLLDVDAFKIADDEILKWLVLDHDLKENIMMVIPYENDAIRELSTNYMSLKLALAKGIKMDEAKLKQLRDIGVDEDFFEALMVLQAMVKAGEEITDEKIIAVAIEHMRTMSYYNELFKKFPFADDWAKEMREVQKARTRYEAAIRVFNEIMDARIGINEVKRKETQKRLKKAVAEAGINIKVLDTFTGKRRILGLEGLSKKMQEMIGIMAKQVHSSQLFAGELIKSNDRKYILVDKDRLDELKGTIGHDKYEQVEKQLSNNNYEVCIKVPEKADLTNIIRLVDPADLENMQRLDKMLYLPMPYTRSSFYMAANIIGSKGELDSIDNLTKNIIKGLYMQILGEAVTDNDLKDIFTAPWKFLPKIRMVLDDINNLRKAAMQIERAA